MKHLTDILKDEGYEPFRFINGEYVKTNFHPMDFSTMRHGGVATFWMKEGRTTFVWGLSEHKKPPTLISPRPRIFIDGDQRMFSDDAMNRCLSSENHKDIYDAIVNGGQFIYDQV